MGLKYEYGEDDWERGNDDCLIYHGWESGSDALTPPRRPSVDLLDQQFGFLMARPHPHGWTVPPE